MSLYVAEIEQTQNAISRVLFSPDSPIRGEKTYGKPTELGGWGNI